MSPRFILFSSKGRSRLLLLGVLLFVAWAILSLAGSPRNGHSADDIQRDGIANEANSRTQITRIRPSRTKWVFSLTTLPSRLAVLDETLDSLLNQSAPADRVLVNIPPTFRGVPFDAESDLARLRAKYVHRVLFSRAKEDYGPGTKLLGSLDLINENEDVWIVTVDDDVAYFPETIKGFTQALSETFEPRPPAMGYAGLIYPNLRALPHGNGARLDIIEGWAAAAYHRSMFSATSKFLSCFNEVGKNPACRMADDLVISNWLAFNNVKRRLIEYPWANRWRLMREGRLREKVSEDANALHKSGGNWERYEVCERHLKEKEGKGGGKWWGFGRGT